MAEIQLLVNGAAALLNVDVRTTLADALRGGLGLTGTHLGCEQGVCGSCTILLDDHTARACLLLAVSCEGRDIWTVEGLAADPGLDEVRGAFSRHHALQCGFCTPGFLATVVEMIRERFEPNERLVRDRLSGNLCRCTGYQNIVDATMDLLARQSSAGPA